MYYSCTHGRCKSVHLAGMKLLKSSKIIIYKTSDAMYYIACNILNLDYVDVGSAILKLCLDKFDIKKVSEV